MRICSCCNQMLFDFDQYRFVHKACYEKLLEEVLELKQELETLRSVLSSMGIGEE